MFQSRTINIVMYIMPILISGSVITLNCILEFSTQISYIYQLLLSRINPLTAILCNRIVIISLGII